MDNEVEVEKMAKAVNGGCRVPCKECKERALCEVKHFAEELVEDGYRKADEVRKETAKEILQDLYDEASKYCDDTMGLNTYEIKQLAKKYGVEVDE